MKTESSAYDLGLADGEKKVLAALMDTADSYGDAGMSASAKALYQFIKSCIMCRRLENERTVQE